MPDRQTALRVGTWNVNWAKPGTERGRCIAKHLATSDCDVLCVTEGCAGLFPAGGHVIDAGPDWGYAAAEGRRKVLLWSKRPWSAVDPVGSEALPGGRFVSAMTETSLGALSVVGICIPCRDAHVRTGRRDRAGWQDHEAWLSGFETLPCQQARERTVVLGDFNQRIPRRGQPKRVYRALRDAFSGFCFATAGELVGTAETSIDHIAHTPDLALAGDIRIWPKRSARFNLSDHSMGVWGDFVLQEADQSRIEVEPGGFHDNLRGSDHRDVARD